MLSVLNGIKILQVLNTTIGAVHQKSGESAFRVFDVQRDLMASCPGKKHLHIGLGAGVSANGTNHDVLEKYQSVMDLAVSEFGFNTLGNIYIQDALKFETHVRYDCVLLDVHPSDGIPMLSNVNNHTTDDAWLFMNIFEDEPSALHRVYIGLKQFFPYISVFSETRDTGNNHIFFASKKFIGSVRLKDYQMRHHAGTHW